MTDRRGKPLFSPGRGEAGHHEPKRVQPLSAAPDENGRWTLRRLRRWAMHESRIYLPNVEMSAIDDPLNTRYDADAKEIRSDHRGDIAGVPDGGNYPLQ